MLIPKLIYLQKVFWRFKAEESIGGCEGFILQFTLNEHDCVELLITLCSEVFKKTDKKPKKMNIWKVHKVMIFLWRFEPTLYWFQDNP